MSPLKRSFSDSDDAPLDCDDALLLVVEGVRLESDPLDCEDALLLVVEGVRLESDPWEWLDLKESLEWLDLKDASLGEREDDTFDGEPDEDE